MSLEQAIEKIDAIQLNRGIASHSPVAISDEHLFDEIKPILKDLPFFQNLFYLGIDRVQEWINLELPEPEDYGKNAVSWLRNEKMTHYGLWGGLVGSIVGVIGGIAEIPYLLYSGMGTAMVGFVGLHINRYRTEVLEFEPDAGEYISDLSRYMSLRDSIHGENRVLDLEESAELYEKTLNKFIWILQKNGFKEENYGLLNFELDKIQIIKNHFSEMVNQIDYSKKKSPIPKYGGGIAPHLISASSSDIIETLGTAVNYVKNGDKLIENFLKIPTLFEVKD